MENKAIKIKILLIEDEALSVAIYEKILKTAGFSVETIRFGNEAVARLEQIRRGEKEKPDLVLLDLVLPDVGGMEILKKYQQENETKDIPIFIFTNYVARDSQKTGIKLGAAKYFVKTDITPSELVKTIKEFFSK